MLEVRSPAQSPPGKQGMTYSFPSGSDREEHEGEPGHRDGEEGFSSSQTVARSNVERRHYMTFKSNAFHNLFQASLQNPECRSLDRRLDVDQAGSSPASLKKRSGY